LDKSEHLLDNLEKLVHDLEFAQIEVQVRVLKMSCMLYNINEGRNANCNCQFLFRRFWTV
jgi:hypothetical protein